MDNRDKIRREHIRWIVLLTLNNARPIGAYDSVILSVIRAEYPDVAINEVRQHLDYMNERELIHAKKEPDGRWFARLARYGIDVVEYTVDCEPGIARPEKYW